MRRYFLHSLLIVVFQLYSCRQNIPTGKILEKYASQNIKVSEQLIQKLENSNSFLESLTPVASATVRLKFRLESDNAFYVSQKYRLFLIGYDAQEIYIYNFEGDSLGVIKGYDPEAIKCTGCKYRAKIKVIDSLIYLFSELGSVLPAFNFSGNFVKKLKTYDLPGLSQDYYLNEYYVSESYFVLQTQKRKEDFYVSENILFIYKNFDKPIAKFIISENDIYSKNCPPIINYGESILLTTFANNVIYQYDLKSQTMRIFSKLDFDNSNFIRNIIEEKNYDIFFDEKSLNDSQIEYVKKIAFNNGLIFAQTNKNLYLLYENNNQITTKKFILPPIKFDDIHPIYREFYRQYQIDSLSNLIVFEDCITFYSYEIDKNNDTIFRLNVFSF